MFNKQVIYPGRVRRIPKQFSWIDHRLIRDGHIESISHAGAALYLFLAAVSDKQGLSYYSDPSIGKRLSMDSNCLQMARDNLIHAGLIAYQKPVYQVLDLNPPRLSHEPERKNPGKGGEMLSLGQILKRAMEGDHD